MMRLLLADHAYAACRHEDLVVLDAGAGDYLCLPGAGRAAAPEPGSNVLAVTDAGLAEALVELGLTLPDEAAPRPRLRVAAPTRDAVSGPRPVPTAAQAVRMGLAGVDMLMTYWRRPFTEVVGGERAARPAHPSPPEQLVVEARGFAALLPWVPFQGECLFRSVMLRAFLARAGLTARFVIGVRTFPFEAHCWLQAGDLVLDDAAEHAASFTPIFVR